MTYWKQFAESLGLELGEEFVITDSYGERKDEDVYKITENGLYYRTPTSINWFTEPANTIERLLNGCDIAVPKPWELKVGEKYFYYSVSLNRATTRKWCNGNYDLLLWKFGNCFKTEKEANEKGKEIMEQIKKEYEEA